MAVRIRMKRMGRKHRSFFRICAVDSRHPRDGRVLEELGTYDPMVPETDARALLNGERLAYWLGVGAQPSEKVKVLIKKYGPSGTHVAQQQAARERMAAPKALPDPGAPAFVVGKTLAKAAGDANGGSPKEEASSRKESEEPASVAE